MRLCVFFSAISCVAFAGGCAETPQRDAFRSAKLVFEGRVEKVEPVGGYSLHPTARVDIQQPLTGSPAVITLAASRFWKGQSRRTVKVLVLQKPSSGGEYTFQVGHEYVLYTNGPTTWDKVVNMAARTPVYDLGGECPLRIRSDAAAEAQGLVQSTR